MMRNPFHRFCCFSALLLLAGIVLGACSAQVTPGIAQTEINAKTGSLLSAMNEGDYATFSQDFSQTMKDAIPEAQFEELRNQVLEASGNYVSLGEEPTIQSSKGYAIYSYLCEFEQEEVKVTVSFAGGGDQIEGLFFDSKNLRQNSGK